MRYDTVFLDVDGTLLWVDLDVEGYVRDLGRYAKDGPITVEAAAGPIQESIRTHISENIKYPTREELEAFKKANAEKTARMLGVEAPVEVLAEIADRRISFRPYPETEEVLGELRRMGCRIYVVSNWDVLLEEVLRDLGWLEFFDGLVVSAVVGEEKPGREIFEEALRVSGMEDVRDRTLHVGNDPVADIRGAAAVGIGAVLVDRRGDLESPEALAKIPDLRPLPRLIRG
ncbi:HAD family hydrolase [Rubrobacter calidifluminis]|uniref:HAD family hydrolase n=1 Tax=Rubrobacter calidifluminis TaxID=1392640 RepID=UPI002362D75B|nr:HAD-IA family hydrolase [Rubrobacter calidifluminis]